MLPARSVAISIALLSILPLTAPRASGAVAVLEPGFTIERTHYGLGVLTALAFSPDGALFLAEKGGNLLVIPPGETAPRPFATIPVYTNSECGLIGLTLGPDHTGSGSGGHVYVFATISSSEQRIIRLRDVAGTGAERADIIAGLPTLGQNHDGGGLRIGPDGKIYCSIGDNGGLTTRAQDVKLLVGKVLRYNIDGSIPDDNPDLSAVDPAYRREIFAWGFRNPFRIALRPLGPGPGDFQLFVNDVGSSGGSRREEIDIVLPGKNYGWPIVEGIANRAEFVDPIYVYSQEGSAVVGGTFYRGAAFPPTHRGNYFFMDYVSDRVFRMVLDGDRAVSVTAFATVWGGSTEIAESPDGALVLCTTNGQVFRIAATSVALSAAIEADPLRGQAPLEVRFAARPSGGNAASYSFHWDFGDGSTSTDRDPLHTFLEPGTYRVGLAVEDGTARAEAQVDIAVDTPDLLPIPEILGPAEGTVFPAGATVEFSGRASDPEDGELPGTSLAWKVTLLHDDHTHPWLDGAEGPAGSFSVPVTGIEEGWSFRIELTARDASGGTATATRLVELDYLPLVLETDPPGLLVTAGGVSFTGPAVYEAARGAWVELGAPSPQAIGGRLYFFAGFSDGGAQYHEVVAAPGLAFTARFIVEPAAFIRGDAIGDGTLDLSDAVFALYSLFLGGPPPECPDAADANDDGLFDITDPIALLISLFVDGAPLPPPTTGPGLDPTPDGLKCRER